MKLVSSTLAFILRHAKLCFFVVFVLYIGFVDSNSIWERHFVWQNTDRLREEIADYKQRYSQDSLELATLKNNPYRLEQVARERYYMTRENEDLFIIEE